MERHLVLSDVTQPDILQATAPSAYYTIIKIRNSAQLFQSLVNLNERLGNCNSFCSQQ